MLSIRFARAAALASALLIGLSSAAAYARPPAPPPGWGGPGFHRPPPLPPPRYYRPHHHRNWGWVAPLALGGLIVGAELYSRPERVEVPVPYPVPVPAQPAAPAPAAQHAWYWCSTAKGYYPGVATCPVPWTIIMGTSPTEPPAPPM